MLFHTLVLLSLFSSTPQDSNWQKRREFQKFTDKFVHTGTPYVFGKDNTFEFRVYEGDTIPRAVKLKYFPPQRYSLSYEYGQKSYYICPFYNDSLVGLIYKVQHGTGYDFVLILYDSKLFKPIDSMLLFGRSENGAWSEGMIDSSLTITQSFYYYDKWWDFENKVLKTKGTNVLKATRKGFEVIEGEKVEDPYW